VIGETLESLPRTPRIGSRRHAKASGPIGIEWQRSGAPSACAASDETFKPRPDRTSCQGARHRGLTSRPEMPSCCAWNEKSRSRRSTAASQCCRCAPASRRDAVRLHPPRTTSVVFAALDIATARSSAVLRRHRALSSASSWTNRGGQCHALDVHLVMDNYATHKTPLIRAWLAEKAALARASDATSSSCSIRSEPSRLC